MTKHSSFPSPFNMPLLETISTCRGEALKPGLADIERRGATLIRPEQAPQIRHHTSLPPGRALADLVTGGEQEAQLFKVRSHHSPWQRCDEQVAGVCSHILERMRDSPWEKERGPLRDTHSAVCHFDQEGSLHNPEKLIMVDMQVLRWSKPGRHNFHPDINGSVRRCSSRFPHLGDVARKHRCLALISFQQNRESKGIIAGLLSYQMGKKRRGPNMVCELQPNFTPSLSCSEICDGGNDLPTNDFERLNPGDLRNHTQDRLDPHRGEPRSCPISSPTLEPSSPTSKAKAQVFSIAS